MLISPNSPFLIRKILLLILFNVFENTHLPCLAWLSGLSADLRTKRSLVQFPVRAHAWVVGQVPIWGRERGNPSIFPLHITVSVPPRSLKINK